MNRPEFRLIAAILIGFFLTGCPALWTSETVVKNTPPAQLYREADDLFQKKDYSIAIDAFERLKSAHPDFQKTPDAYLKIADALFQNGAYEKAVSRYHQFIELYPLHKEVARAKYQIALSYFNQIRTADLDNSVVQAALNAFKTLSEDPKAGEWAKKAEEKFKECQKKLAEKELDKARTYWSMGRYQAARISAKRVLEEYSKLGYDAEANDWLKKLKDKK